ncbi:unnamed protein product [Paramecium octaurelia]|uniref:SET domain-containing protein n=1 Tax=Paramecium octaurelia TaxID=43137 RepID=A0A8S1WU67_PAROT|nr:unnamed protein product [Paramecium octaurelia]
MKSTQMTKEQISEEYTLYKRYVQHLQSTLLQDEGQIQREIKVNVIRTEAYEIDIKVKRNRDNLPIRTNYYKSMPGNIRLQHPTPVLLERLTPLSIPTKLTEDIEEHVQNLEQGLAKSIDDSKHYLRLEHKLFIDFFFEKFKEKFTSLQVVFQLQQLAQAIGCSADQVQSYYLAKQAKKYDQFVNFNVKYQFVRFNRYFCPICNLYLCSLHYHSKNQRLYIEKEPEEEPQDQQKDDPTHHDNFYETEFKPNSLLLRELFGRYKLNNKMEMEQRCRDITQCGKYGVDQMKMKKFQQKSIEQMLEFGFSNCCFMARVLTHRIYPVTCQQINYLIKTLKSQSKKHMTNGKRKQQQASKKQNLNNYAQQYIPCFHEGECGSNSCTCVTCHKYCCCKGQCQQKSKSCDCRVCGYDEKKQKHSCPCYISGYECDPQLCKCQSCSNKNLLLQVRKQLVLGKSLICNGLGLFAAQNFKVCDFVGEYTGNYILLDDESMAIEQCDWITNNHYLFEVDDKWQVDGTYYSNCLRYINHATKKSDLANCQAQILFSEGRWRIAMFTTKNIQIGEELFFDYGDKFLTKWLTDFNKLCDDYYKK